MRVIRTPARQAHAVPQTAHRPQGPFPAEVLRPPVVSSLDIDEPDPRLTAQGWSPEVTDGPYER